MVLAPEAAAIGVAATVGLAAGAVAGRALTPAASAVAALFGSAIVVLAGFPYLLLLALFVLASALATRYRFAEKRAGRVQEGVAGERGIPNVVAHILIPTGIAAGFAAAPSFGALDRILYASALAFGASDTLASELGVLAGRARSILSFRPVAPGTNGGVSGAGEGFGFAGAAVTAVVALGLFTAFGGGVRDPLAFVGIVAGAGFAGCQIDSVVGELVENRGYLGKGGTNFVGMLATVAIAAGLGLLLGGGP